MRPATLRRLPGLCLSAVVALGFWRFASTIYDRQIDARRLTRMEHVAHFKTENAFYASYFDDVLRAPSPLAALRGVVGNNRTEYPNTINALHRFNVAQEVTLGLAHRAAHAAGAWLPRPLAVALRLPGIHSHGGGTRGGTGGGGGRGRVAGASGEGVLADDPLYDPLLFYVESEFLLYGIGTKRERERERERERVCVCVCVCKRERHTHTQRERQTDRQTETDRESGRERESGRDRDRDRQTEAETKTKRQQERDTCVVKEMFFVCGKAPFPPHFSPSLSSS
jgi:hypothetical protein